AVNLLNDLLSFIQIPLKIRTLDDCVSSIWVALYEGLFGVQLEGVESGFLTGNSGETNIREIQIRNCQIVINALGEKGRKIDAESIINCNKAEILKIITMFASTASNMDLKDTKAEIAHIHEPPERSFQSSTHSTIESGASKLSNRSRVNPRVPKPLKYESSFSDVKDDWMEFEQSDSKNVFQPLRSNDDSSGKSQYPDETSSIGQPSSKRIRFDLKPVYSSPNQLLQIKQSDSPYTRALKMRRLRLMSDSEQLKARTSSRVTEFKKSSSAIKLSSVVRQTQNQNFIRQTSFSSDFTFESPRFEKKTYFILILD
ncbi:hypothetical protein HK096_000133, partial [Nowakowskiella sp. JEL0078]